MTGNKGEWSEIYTLFKTLGDTKLYSGDENLNKVENVFYPIIKILRQEIDGNYEYIIDKDIVIVSGGEKEIRVSINEFAQKAKKLFHEIKTRNSTFSLPEIEAFMDAIHCKTLKAKSADKTDIRIVVHDSRTGLQPQLGFSIKSRLGSPSTLLNSSADNTNFIYNVSGLIQEQIDEINSIKKFQDKFQRIKQYDGKITFVSPASALVESNLTYVDDSLPELIGLVIYLYYSTNNSTIKDIIHVVTNANPRKYNYTFKQDFYAHKIKRFLTDVALGLKMGKAWEGKYEANGGYLIVKEDGDIICYHIYDKTAFEDYLFNNTRLDTPSTSRHDFGSIYKVDDSYFMKLNLQIRFM